MTGERTIRCQAETECIHRGADGSVISIERTSRPVMATIDGSGKVTDIEEIEEK